MRKQIYNLNCRKQTSGVQGAAPLAVVPLIDQRAGVKGAAPLAGDRGRSLQNKNKLLTS